MSTTSVERTFSSLTRIKTCAIRQGRLDSALALMVIEKDFLIELKRTDNLYDRVIEILRKERRMDLVHK